MAFPAAGPLQGIRIIDLSAIVMGPLATQVLADLGADVIKVEPPEGDILRKAGAPGGRANGPLFLHANRNKRAIVLDLKSPGDRAILLDLLRDADVFAHSMRPPALKRLGLDHATLAADHPGLIHVGMFGFGQDGPYAAEGAFDDMIQAMSGLADLNGRVSGGAPRYVPGNLADRMTGFHAASLISAAIAGRLLHGQGAALEIPMFETFAAQVLGDHLFGHSYQPAQGDMGYGRIVVPDRGPLPTADGHLCAMIYTDAQWRAFLGLIGQDPDLAQHPRLADMRTRTAHAEALFAWVSGHTRQRSTADWLAAFRAVGLPAMPMNRIEDLPDDPHLKAVGFFAPARHAEEGEIRLMRPAATIAGWDRPVRHAPPVLGEHNPEILGRPVPGQKGPPDDP